jgi:hypothetical protein
MAMLLLIVDVAILGRALPDDIYFAMKCRADGTGCAGPAWMDRKTVRHLHNTNIISHKNLCFVIGNAAIL